MCGGAERNEKPKSELRPGETYNPAALKDVYAQFKETGKVPYSYYGVAAPTREGELDLVRASYPGSFTQGPVPQQPEQPRRRFGLWGLMDALSGRNWMGRDQ